VVQLGLPIPFVLRKTLYAPFSARHGKVAARVEFYRKYFGFSPDNGNGSIEAL
jgi:hypothetical protein